MRVSGGRCGYCHSEKTMWRRVWPYGLILLVTVAFVGAAALSRPPATSAAISAEYLVGAQ